MAARKHTKPKRRTTPPAIPTGLGFTVLLHDEAEGLDKLVDWNAPVPLTAAMRRMANYPGAKQIVQRGRLAKAFVLGQQVIPRGKAVFMDGFGVYYIES